ncbi:MAG: GNAT family N-acetyltransferase [Burkholderiales bacterium]|jgi:GNAT superfamily N-acetyltransferase|nr:GNAT family N-acetyltransferase [Burkholderiales bacterium]
MKIRLADMSDVERVMQVSHGLYAESRFQRYAWNAVKAQAAIEALVSNPRVSCIMLAEHINDGIVGVLAGYVADLFFADGRVAQDKWFYVRPEYRGSSAALKLMMAFRRWAENRAVDELCINMSVDIDQERFNRFMHHLNFISCGTNFVLPLNKVKGK